MKNMLRIWAIVIFILIQSAWNTVSFAQTDPVYSHAIFNMQISNPSYVGTWAGSGYLVNIRRQWTGMENAPSTQTFSFQKQDFKQHIGWGFNIINDKVGLEKRLSVSGDYSYRLELGWKSYFYMGLRFGINNYINNLSDYTTYDPNFDTDPAFQGEIRRNLVPNFGIGFLLQSEIWQLSLSVPNIIQLEYDSNLTDLNSYTEMRHYLLSGGYVFKLNYSIFLKPSLRFLVVKGAPLEIQPSVEVLFLPKMWLGTFYRYHESAGVTAQWVFSKNMRFGYAFEFPVTQMSRYQFGTHEVMFSYEINFTRNNKYNFRFF